MRGLTLAEARAAFLFQDQLVDEKELEITVKRMVPEGKPENYHQTNSAWR